MGIYSCLICSSIDDGGNFIVYDPVCKYCEFLNDGTDCGWKEEHLCPGCIKWNGCKKHSGKHRELDEKIEQKEKEDLEGMQNKYELKKEEIKKAFDVFIKHSYNPCGEFCDLYVEYKINEEKNK